MNILAIGNSFSQDATRYLQAIARSQGEKWNVVNLYIGGCSLEQHYRNMLRENEAYGLQINGNLSGFYVSLKEALLNRPWDVITLQQASHYSAFYHTYQPYLNELVAYVRKLCPKAKVYIHQTWAYEAGSQKLESVSFPTPEAMFAEVEKAYAQAAADICADGIIPSGKLMLQLSEHTTVHRDTFHASLGIGRLALGLLWYTTLSGQRIADCTFRDTDEPVDEALVATAIALVESLTM